MKYYKTQLDIDEDTWIALSRIAIEKDMTPKEFVIQLIKQAVKECNIVNS